MTKLVDDVAKAIWEANDHPHIEGKDYQKAEASAAIAVFARYLREPDYKILDAIITYHQLLTLDRATVAKVMDALAAHIEEQK